MKRLIIVVLAVGVIAAVLGAVALDGNDASAAPKEASPFVGEWGAIDTFDGSYMQVKITGHDQPMHMKFVDDWAVQCPEGGPLTIIGKVAYSNPFIMEVETRARCHIGNYDLGVGPIGFDYIWGDDILLDHHGVVWTRV